MKAKYLMLIAALAFTFTACEKNEPFDTQSPDDAPQILKPYNESGTGSFTYNLANPDIPLYDSVTVTPSAYTTVNWYLDGERVFTGTKINMCFPAGHYTLTIEAVTTAGKRTERTGSVTVNPFPADPSSSAPAAGRHFVPGNPSTIEGANLTKVVAVIVSNDIFFKDIVCTIETTTTDDASLTFTLPDMKDGRYFLRLKDAEGMTYGADAINVHNVAVALDGYQQFVPGEAWTITGVKLNDVASVQVDETVITELTATATSVTFVAPEAEVGEHKVSMKNADGSNVYFITDEGLVTEVTTIVSAETTIWEGPVALDWNAELVKVTSGTFASVPVGSTILVYFEITEADYHAMRITTPWWGDPATLETDLVLQFDVTGETPNPFSFTYDDRCKGLVEERGAMSIVGHGATINKITFK